MTESNSYYKRTITPEMAKGVFGENTLCGASKMLFCEHEKATLFGGNAIPNISTETDGNWHMVVGSLIFVPLKSFVWKQGVCGWSIEDLLAGGFGMEYWKEKI